jgi:hypothetical protein
MVLDRLDHHRHFIPAIAKAQFNHWGPLTGFNSASDYSTAQLRWSTGGDLPFVLIALDRGNLLGSVNLLRSEMTIRPALTPWRQTAA